MTDRRIHFKHPSQPGPLCNHRRCFGKWGTDDTEKVTCMFCLSRLAADGDEDAAARLATRRETCPTDGPPLRVHMPRLRSVRGFSVCGLHKVAMASSPNEVTCRNCLAKFAEREEAR